MLGRRSPVLRRRPRQGLTVASILQASPVPHTPRSGLPLLHGDSPTLFRTQQTPGRTARLTPVSLAARSRHCRRAPRSGPPRTPITPQVEYAFNADPPQPNPGPSEALQPPVRLFRRSATAGGRLRRPSAAARAPNLPGPSDPRRATEIRTAYPLDLDREIVIQWIRSVHTASPWPIC